MISANGATHALSPDNGKRIRLARWCDRVGILPALQGLRRVLRNDVRILAYHRILDIPDISTFKFDLAVVSASTRQFREQLVLVKRHFRLVTFRDLIAALDGGPALPADAVLITFDDGYDDNYRVAFPILRELGVSAMFFVSTGHIDTGLPYIYDWLVYMVCATSSDRLTVPEIGVDLPLPPDLAERRRIADTLLERVKRSDDATQQAAIMRLQREWNMPCVPHPDCHPMNWDQLREMQAAGMEIGSHGVDHRMLAKLPQAELVREIAGSKAALDAHLGRPAEVISYPVGGFDAYDDRVIGIAQQAGYRAACTYIVGTNRLKATSSRYALKRLAVEREMDAAWFSAMTTLPELFGYSSDRNGK